MAVLWSLTCAAVILSLLQENDLSNSIPHRVKCGTAAVNDLHGLQKLEKWWKVFFIDAKLDKVTESVWPHQTLFQRQLGYVWPTVSHLKALHIKTWQALLLFLKLRIQNLKRKKWRDTAYYVPSVPHQIEPMVGPGRHLASLRHCLQLYQTLNVILPNFFKRLFYFLLIRNVVVNNES